jgi:hypothetical protein
MGNLWIAWVYAFNFHIFRFTSSRVLSDCKRAVLEKWARSATVPAQASGMDPQQRHVLETSYEALFNAGR